MNSAFRALPLSLFVVFLLVVIAAFPPTLFGQAVFGSISGSVTDPSGAGIPGAKVIIIDAGKGVSYNTSTNESGLYTQSHLIVGLYEIRIEATGFSAYVQRKRERRCRRGYPSKCSAYDRPIGSGRKRLG